MRILVQKFGGTSLMDETGRNQCIKHINMAKESGYRVVVIVSAMGRIGDPYATDSLISILDENGKWLPKREMDLLLSTGEIISSAVLSNQLWKMGIANKILTGGQSGIITNDHFNNALITELIPTRVKEALQSGDVVIVPGFQGQTLDGDVTTLGRGGSDITATALGIALKTDCVEIFTDVEGIMTADPRIVNEALKHDIVTYEEIYELAQLGANVIHPRAIEIARQGNIPIRIRSTFSLEEGTLITSINENQTVQKLSKRHITGITHLPNLTQIRIHTDLDQYETLRWVNNLMSKYKININYIRLIPNGIVYIVLDDMAEQVKQILGNMGFNSDFTPHCTKVSVVGSNLTVPSVFLNNIVNILRDENIQIIQTDYSTKNIWVLVNNSDMERTVRSIHKNFMFHLTKT